MCCTVDHVPPMPALAGEPPAGPGWAVEFTCDGMRALAAVARGQAQLTSRLGTNITASSPELAAVLAAVTDRAVLLDGVSPHVRVPPSVTDMPGREQLTMLEQPHSPFGEPVAADCAHWVRPTLVGQVEYRTSTRSNRLRHPAWKGLRVDTRPADVVL